MRSALAFVFVLSVNGFNPVELAAKPIQQEFSQAWTDRAARYGDQQKALNQRVETSLKALHEASEAKSPEVKAKTDQFLAALQDGAYMHGRISLLKVFQSHMAKKPSAAATELWIQEQTDSLRVQAEALDKLGERLGADKSNEGMKAKMSALAASAEFMGTLAELSLIDQNLPAPRGCASAHGSRPSRDAGNVAFYAVEQPVEFVLVGPFIHARQPRLFGHVADGVDGASDHLAPSDNLGVYGGFPFGLDCVPSAKACLLAVVGFPRVEFCDERGKLRSFLEVLRSMVCRSAS